MSVPISHYPTEVDGAVNAALLGAWSEPADEVVTPLGVVEHISRCRAVVTGSYHAAVFALAQGIPAVGLTGSAYYDAKFAGLADQFGGSGLWIVRLDQDELPARLGRRSTRRGSAPTRWARNYSNVRRVRSRAATGPIGDSASSWRRGRSAREAASGGVWHWAW